ncbi:sigma 54-interacting transcriptional regulator [Alicyclobacillus sp. SO9]|uniref:sigma 54-interacting transcriptional regulator n=1 Tax=Alicyclobacillus sp. SO9 TaxID=2665646 RepID=UPI0018E7B98D|nr:sigma 54-interacting transcriptional regulator [Alicyclobacillus sp. SO9]QQE81291.1 sigma 54-interacting transcriptional regulator [Alicyclobacillus sp. SO9]
MYQVMIVGAGEGGSKLIEALQNQSEVKVSCIVDKNPQAPGFICAETRGIPRYTSYEDALSEQGPPDAVLEVTGDDEVYRHLVKLTNGATTIISGRVAHIFILLLEDKLQLIGQLEERKNELQSVLDATQEGMVSITADGRISLFNKAASQMTGIPVETANGRPVTEVFPDSKLAESLRTGREWRNRKSVINDMEVISHTVPIFGHGNAIVGALEVFRNVTQLRDMAAKITNLSEVQILLESIIQSTQDAISVVDKNGMGLLINPAYTKLTGFRPQDVIGKPADVDIAEGDSMHMRVLQTGRPVKNVPLKVGPAHREVIVNVAPLYVNEELRGSVGVIHDVSEIKHLTDELDKAHTLLRSVQAKYTFTDIVAESSAMVLAVEQARKAAETPATVLLRGESGTGKELFAHAIHNESPRTRHSFVRVNCASLSEGLLESELFGYEEGAFTGAKRGGKKGLFDEASGGTLFLDEVGEMSLSTQARLLRALQEQEIVRVGGTKPIRVDVRVIAATHVNLEQAVASGKFREDLYYRLNVVPITIPPLRYRKGDLESIAMHLIQQQNLLYGRNVERLSASALESLRAYDWPGNVRELENTLGRAMIHMNSYDRVLDVSQLPVLQPGNTAESPGDSKDGLWTIPKGATLHEVVRLAEAAAIRQALQETRGNKTEAARRLGISLRSLYYKLEQLETEGELDLD